MGRGFRQSQASAMGGLDALLDETREANSAPSWTLSTRPGALLARVPWPGGQHTLEIFSLTASHRTLLQEQDRDQRRDCLQVVERLLTEYDKVKDLPHASLLTPGELLVRADDVPSGAISTLRLVAVNRERSVGALARLLGWHPSGAQAFYDSYVGLLGGERQLADQVVSGLSEGDLHAGASRVVDIVTTQTIHGALAGMADLLVSSASFREHFVADESLRARASAYSGQQWMALLCALWAESKDNSNEEVGLQVSQRLG